MTVATRTFRGALAAAGALMLQACAAGPGGHGGPAGAPGAAADAAPLASVEGEFLSGAGERCLRYAADGRPRVACRVPGGVRLVRPVVNETL